MNLPKQFWWCRVGQKPGWRGLKDKATLRKEFWCQEKQGIGWELEGEMQSRKVFVLFRMEEVTMDAEGKGMEKEQL